ncbi:MAG: hypothetical protein JST86_14110 [Bacteroidetes bacterium]|nr:hypothetical protein [Bacteroidota bacterium]
MAVDSMAHQARLLNKKRVWVYFFACCFLLLQCRQKEQHASLLLPDVNTATVDLQTRQGITYINNQPANARVYQLYTNGDTAFTGVYRSGKADGTFIYWYDNKQLKERRTFDAGKLEGTAEGWWPDGKQKFIYHFANDAFEGNVKEWSASGSIYRDMNYQKGQEEGSEKMWYGNGKLRSNYIIHDGHRVGLLGTKNCVNVSDSIFK